MGPLAVCEVSQGHKWKKSLFLNGTMHLVNDKKAYRGQPLKIKQNSFKKLN
jgi:hypothetical protein